MRLAYWVCIHADGSRSGVYDSLVSAEAYKSQFPTVTVVKLCDFNFEVTNVETF